jgi:putative endonuclease
MFFSEAGYDRLSRVKLGRLAEDAAVSYLFNSNYDVFLRNYRCKEGEIDILAWDGSVLCFVEVRARTGAEHGSPLESIGAQKKARLIKAARDFLHLQWEGPLPVMRFDAVGVVFEEGEEPLCTLIKGAFETAEATGC